MSSFPSDFVFPIYISLATKEEYVAKNDIYAYYRSQFEDILKKYDTPLPVETRNFLESYEKELVGTCEFVVASKWLAARADWRSAHAQSDSVFKMFDSTGNILQTISRRGIRFDCLLLQKVIEGMMKNHPGVLLPYEKDNKLKAVRLFKEGKNSFAMADELENAVSGTVRRRDPMELLETVDLRTVLEASKRSKLEILVTNVNESPVWTPTGRRCGLPSIVLLEIVVAVTLQKQVFSHKLATRQKILEKFGSVIRKVFPLHKKERFFMTEERIMEIKQAIQEVFVDVKRRKTTLKMTSVDRQLSYFTTLFPELMDFFHTHNGCYLFEYIRCPHCRVTPTIDFEQEAMEMLGELEKTANKSNLQIIEEPTSSEEHKHPEETTTAVAKKKRKNKNKKASPKTLETSDNNFPEESATTSSETSDAETTDSAYFSAKSDTEDVPIKTVESTSTCQKCFRTSEYCKKAKEQLKTTQNLVKKLEKKQSETEKSMEEMKKKMQEEMDALKLQMEQLKDANEQQKLENQKQVEMLKKENEELKAENAKLKEATPSTASTPEEPPLTQKERVQLIREFQEKKMELQGSQIYSHTELKVLRLIGTKPDIQKMVQYDHINFKAQFHTYLRVLGTTLNELQNNEKMSRSQIPALPVYPAMSERFNTEFQKMMDEENKKLDEECMICTEVVDKKKLENVFTCPVCQNSIHLCCVERWFQRSQTCPCCRTEWN